MTTQFQYSTLAHQTAAVQSIADVFTDVRFVPPVNVQSNPTMVPTEAAPTLRANIDTIRARNHVHAGEVQVHSTPMPALGLDVLMETGTGKTLPLSKPSQLHKDRLSKFIAWSQQRDSPRHAKSLQTTRRFSQAVRHQKINVQLLGPRSGFIHAAKRYFVWWHYHRLRVTARSSTSAGWRPICLAKPRVSWKHWPLFAPCSSLTTASFEGKCKIFAKFNPLYDSFWCTSSKRT